MAKLLTDSTILPITSLNDADYMNTVDAATGKISKITVANVKASIGAPLVYAALLTQASTSAPTASIALNTTGTTITFARTSSGVYTATAGAAVFTANKTLVFLQNVFGTRLVTAVITSTTVITLSVFNAGTFTGEDDSLSGSSFKIEIYP